MEGTVKWYDEDKGYGRIEGADGEEFFIEAINIDVVGLRSLRPGQRVKFTVAEGNPKRERIATNLTLVF